MIQFFLFGDGAASILLSGESSSFLSDRQCGGLSLQYTKHLTNVNNGDELLAHFGTGGSLIPQSSDEEVPFLMSPKLPIRGVQYTNYLLSELCEHELKKIKKWVVHTGSKKILNLIQRKLEVSEHEMQASYDVLRECGNVTPCSLPFRIKKIMNVDGDLKSGDRVGVLGFGNGFSASFAMMEANG